VKDGQKENSSCNRQADSELHSVASLDDSPLMWTRQGRGQALAQQHTSGALPTHPTSSPLLGMFDNHSLASLHSRLTPTLPTLPHLPQHPPQSLVWAA